jgi:hypothetical protein
MPLRVKLRANAKEGAMKLHAALILTTLLACSASAFAQTVGIHVANDDIEDLYVAVFDQNQSGQGVFNQRLNKGSRVDLPVTADGSGNGSVTWRAVTTSTPEKAGCGSASGLGAGSEVTVKTFGMGVSPC